MKFSYFRSNKDTKPDGSLTVDNFLNGIKSGTWKQTVDAVRKKKDSPHYKRLKSTLPAVTISALCNVRQADKVKAHSGLICIDVDKKDNPKLRTVDVVDAGALAQFISPSGEGLKIIYRCESTLDAAKHRRIYDAIQVRLTKLGIALKPDPIVKSIVSLQFVSYDPDLYWKETKVIIKALPALKVKKVTANPDATKELNEYIAKLGNVDVTESYEDWLNVMFGLSYSLGEAGREPMHRICRNYKGYSKGECDEKFDACLESGQSTSTPVTVATVFQLLADGMSKPNAKQLQKKYNKSHAKGTIGKGVEVVDGPPELMGMVRFGLFLFKPIVDKKTNAIIDLVPTELDLNEFERLLIRLGFARHERFFIHVQENIVDLIDVPAILYRVTRAVEGSGDYTFEYKGVEYSFRNEEIALRWRKIRAGASTYNQVVASLPYWTPNILKDAAHESYIPYQNGVVVVSAKEIKLTPYSHIHAQVWRERILPRAFKYDRTRGMFEDFFVNVMGRGESTLQRVRSENYLRAVWYYGYILQGTKRQSTARAWILYDVVTGNNGRSGKTLLGTGVGHIRSVAVVDGKRTDLTDRFAFQNVRPWTDVIVIDDPGKRASLDPLFNMISGTTLADRKGVDPIERSLKVMILSNWFLEMSGRSETGRQFVSQLDDFYSRYSKEHMDTIQPLVDLHGKEFFTDWDAIDWRRFDSFSLRCLQHHLKTAPPANTIIGNAAQMRFIQVYEEETFYELCVALIAHTKPCGSGSAIVCALLIQVVKDHAPDIRKPGIVVKEFLRSVGCSNVRPTTIRISSGPKTAYAFDEKLDGLNFEANLKKQLPK